MPWEKQVADALTLARVPLALAVVAVAFVYGADGVITALGLLVVAATIDTLDGYLARRSGLAGQNWIGAHDLEFDMAFSVALLFYLVKAGNVPLVLAVPYFAVWLLVFWQQDRITHVPAVLFQAPIYAWMALAAILKDARVLLGLVVWGAVMLAFGGRRFFSLRLPGFFRELRRQVARALGDRR